MLLYIVMVANDPSNLNECLKNLTSQFAMDAELLVAGSTMKEAVICSNVMMELDFEKQFSSVRLYLDSTLTLHVVGNGTYSPPAKHIALRYFFILELVEEGKILIDDVKTQDQLADIDDVKTQDQLADLGTKHLCECWLFICLCLSFSDISLHAERKLYILRWSSRHRRSTCEGMA